ncbi:hypothetical protein ABET11_22710 [Priestia megaterium]|uniref:hypothetical protein n=1 Tax=Priestia megaterium TaxID=1404 RepID=UPI002E218C51|nr:hypothetical protein [Priestia sp. OVL9]MCJ7983137.1 hypothetical protein [Priestia sp. OVL9]MED4618945.1 hypothetical protein [Priestia megaterium]
MRKDKVLLANSSLPYYFNLDTLVGKSGPMLTALRTIMMEQPIPACKPMAKSHFYYLC